MGTQKSKENKDSALNGNNGLLTSNEKSLERQKAYSMVLTKDKKLGEGSFGAVYKVKRLKDGQECAAKFIKLSFDSMTEVEKLSFKRELKILQTTHYPFIIEFIEQFTYKD